MCRGNCVSSLWRNPLCTCLAGKDPPEVQLSRDPFQPFWNLTQPVFFFLGASSIISTLICHSHEWVFFRLCLTVFETAVTKSYFAAAIEIQICIYAPFSTQSASPLPNMLPPPSEQTEFLSKSTKMPVDKSAQQSQILFPTVKVFKCPGTHPCQPVWMHVFE